MKRFTTLAAMFGMTAWTIIAASSTAQPIMDGKADPGDGYGSALSVQNTNTHFGDAILGDPVNGGGGSEIDQVFATVANGRLYVTVAGNLERNFNKLEVFIDSTAGGMNTIDGAALPTGVDAFCCGGLGTTSGALQRLSGLTFDAGFEADYYLTFTNGFETVNPMLSDSRTFWAASAHYADLTNGTNGEVVAAGMQLAYRGLPNVLRFPGDYNDNEKVDAADYTVWRDTFGQAMPRGTGADADGSQMVDEADYAIWKANFNADTSLAGIPFTPDVLASGVSEALLGPTLPGLELGELIDRDFALSSGGCMDDTGAGCVASELEFALDLDPGEIGTNQSSHRNFNNTIDLQMAFDNSNTVGVTATEPFETPTTGNPQDVLTGLEFSIPLSEIGDPTDEIKLTIFISNGNHDVISNQFSGTGILLGNVGGPPYPNLEGDYPGNQFVAVPLAGGATEIEASGVPEPSSIALLLIAGLVSCRALRGQRN